MKLPRSLANRAFLVHSSLTRLVSKTTITRLGAILNSAQTLLTPVELQVAGRVLLVSASLDLPDDAQEGDDGIGMDEKAIEARLDPNALRMEFQSEERCEACKGEIKLGNLRKATCEKGHVWGKL